MNLGNLVYMSGFLFLKKIRYGRPEASDFEVYEAAEAANAHAFIQKFPNGYQTIVGERGVTVYNHKIIQFSYVLMYK